MILHCTVVITTKPVYLYKMSEVERSLVARLRGRSKAPPAQCMPYRPAVRAVLPRGFASSISSARVWPIRVETRASTASSTGSTRQIQRFESSTELQTSYTTVVQAVWDHLVQEVIRALGL